MCLKRLLVIWLLLLVGLSPLYSDRVLSEEKYQAIMTALENSDKALESQEIYIQRQKELQELSNQTITMQEKALEQHLTSLKESRKQTVWEKIDWFVKGIILGGLIGVMYGK